MSLPKLIKITQALDVKQCSDLKKFVLYYVSTASDLYQILEAIIKHQSKMKDGDDVDEFSKKHFPNCTKKAFMNYLSQLYGYTEDWIAHHQLQENEYQKDLLVQQWLNKNGLYDVSDQLVNASLKSMDKIEQFDLIKLKGKSELLFERFFSNNPIKYEFDFKQYEEMILSQREYNVAIELIMVSEYINWLKSCNLPKTELSIKVKNELVSRSEGELHELLFMLIELIEDSNYDVLMELKEKILENKILEKSKLYVIIASYVMIKSINLRMQGKIEDVNSLKQIMMHGLNSDLFFSNGKISVQTFHNNIVKIAPFCDMDTLVSFINKNIDQVITQNKDVTQSLAIAQVCMYQKKFNQIQIHLRNWEFENLTQKIIALGLNLIASFMQRKEEPELFINTYKSTQLFFKRNENKIGKYLYLSYKGLLDFMKNIDKGKVIIDLSEYNNLIYRLWCEYIIELKKEGRI